MRLWVGWISLWHAQRHQESPILRGSQEDGPAIHFLMCHPRIRHGWLQNEIALSGYQQRHRYSIIALCSYCFQIRKCFICVPLLNCVLWKYRLKRVLIAAFPRPEVVLWFQNWTFRRKKCVFPALAPEKFRKPLKTRTDNEMMLLHFLEVICTAVILPNKKRYIQD